MQFSDSAPNKPSPATQVTGPILQPRGKTSALAEIDALHQAGRLALHVWEIEYDNNTFPYVTNEIFSKPANTLAKQKPDRMWIQSVSLLPKAQSHMSLKPWGVSEYKNPDWGPFYGYLLSLDQNQPHPPLVARVASGVIISGEDVEKKALHKYMYNDGAISDFYHTLLEDWRRTHHRKDPGITWEKYLEFTTPINRYLREIALADNGALANRALDLLQDKMTSLGESPLPTNEVCVSASLEHVKAIVLPLHTSASASPEDNHAYETQLKLRAALRGLEHLERGYNLPVMFYHINGNEALKGTFTYLAQGKEELMQLGLSSLIEALTIEKNSVEQPADTHGAAVAINKCLGIDVTRKNALEQAQAKLKACNYANASHHPRAAPAQQT